MRCSILFHENFRTNAKINLLLCHKNINIQLSCNGPNFGRMPIYGHTFLLAITQPSWPISVKFSLGHNQTVIYRFCKRNPGFYANLDFSGDQWGCQPCWRQKFQGIKILPKSWLTWSNFCVNCYLEIFRPDSPSIQRYY